MPCKRKKILTQLNFARFLHSFLSTELECDRQECETLARFVLDRGLATLVSDVGEEGYHTLRNLATMHLLQQCHMHTTKPELDVSRFNTK